jgi:O-antigen ligase
MDGWLRWAASVHASRFVSVAVIGLAMSLSVVLTGSRSGLASVLVALGFLGLAGRRSAHGVSGRTATLGLSALLVVGAVAWSGADSVIERFGGAPSELADRVAAWRDTLRIIGDFPVFGSGLNSYGRAMLVYQTGDRTAIFAQAHNDYLQLIAEGGLLVGLPALAAIVLAVSGIRRRLTAGHDDQLTAWIRTGAAAGLIGIATQSLVEFSLQIPGNAVLFVVLMAIALHRSSRSRHAAGL